VGVGDALPLHPVDPGGGRVEQHINQMIGQQVDLVDIQHAPVSGGEQPGREAQLAAREGGGEVERPHHPVLGGPDRQLDERRQSGQQCRQTPGQRGFGGALLTAEQHPTDAWVDGVE
jgi:hypothetical protein